MEFKFRAGDVRPPLSYHSPFTSVEFGGMDYRCDYEMMQNPNYVGEAMWWWEMEMEKEKIREEIFAEEMARKRMLEAEVRREFMVETEMAIRHGGFLFDERWGIPFDPRFPWMNRFDNPWFEERIPYPGCSPFEAPHPGCSPFEAPHPGCTPYEAPRLLMLPESVESEIKPDSEVNTNPNLCGVKRKAITPPTSGASELQSITDSNKKPKEDWICPLCKVTATSERSLSAHLQGRKHKSKEDCLRALRAFMNVHITPQPTKAENPKLRETDETQRNGAAKEQEMQEKDNVVGNANEESTRKCCRYRLGANSCSPG